METKKVDKVPDDNVKTIYKIKVTAIEKTEKAETTTCYESKQDGHLVDRSYDKKDHHDYKSISVLTGDTNISTKEDKVYEQTVDELSVADLAKFINSN